MRLTVRALALAAAAAAAAGIASAQERDSLVAEVATADGQSAGSVTFRQVEHGVVITADLRSLPEGPHGFHVHETGACQPDFKAAGSHYAPQGNKHGYDVAEGYHAGDLPNVHVRADGTATAEFFAPWLTLGEATDADAAPFSLTDQDGSAIMVHAAADDYVSTDSAGERIACGVIASPRG
jgi:superoxide dismutase, Cu-Zn family